MFKLIAVLLATVTLIGCQRSEPRLKVVQTEQVATTEDAPKVKDYNFNFIISNPNVNMAGSSKPNTEESQSRARLSDVTKSSIDTLSVDLNRAILIEGPIRDNVLEAAAIIKQLDTESNEPIYILIDSPGGSIFDGARVVSAMQHAKAPIYTVCLKLCASMAFIIHQYGSKRYMQDRSVLMSHFASTSTEGDVERMKSYIELVQKYVDRFSEEIAKRAGLELEVYRAMISKDLWMTEREATDRNFNDAVIELGI